MDDAVLILMGFGIGLVVATFEMGLASAAREDDFRRITKELIEERDEAYQQLQELTDKYENLKQYGE